MIVRPHLWTHALARGGETGTLTVSRIRDGVVLWQRTQAHRDAITHLAWSPDGQMLASGGQDGMVRVWQAKTGKLLRAFPHGEPVWRLQWSPQGTLASTSRNAIHLWSLAAPGTPAAV